MHTFITLHILEQDLSVLCGFWQAAGPYRELFAAAGEAWYHQEHPDFEPKLCFYAFDAAVEHAEVECGSIWSAHRACMVCKSNNDVSFSRVYVYIHVVYSTLYPSVSCRFFVDLCCWSSIGHAL